jgi:hypothetical protein
MTAPPIWDNYKVIGMVAKSESKKIEVAIGVRDGVKSIFLHEMYYHPRDGRDWQSYRYGIVIPLLIPVMKGTGRLRPFEKLLPLLAQAVIELEDMELADPEHEVRRGE